MKMERKKLERIINFIREEMMAAGTGGFSSSADSKGPVAGFDPVMKPKKKRYIWTRGIRKNWMPKNETK